MADPALTESRIIDLEIRLTHQEATLQALNSTVVRQQKMLDALLHKITTLEEQLRAGGGVAQVPDDAPPPHY